MIEENVSPDCPEEGGHPGQSPKVEQLESVVIRFAGDSGDGMQLTGTEFSKSVASGGYEFVTHPDYPAEIRAPAGTLFGVSAYQVQYSNNPVYTSGEDLDVLVAMNPAALKVNLDDLRQGRTIVVNTGAFTASNLRKAKYETNPLEDGSLDIYRVIPIDISALTTTALKESGLSRTDIGRCKNYYALGFILYLHNRLLDKEIDNISTKFASKPEIGAANITALRSGYAYGEVCEIFDTTYCVSDNLSMPPGKYRSVTGNMATAMAMVTASEQSGIKVFLGSYPITPATDILHNLVNLSHFNITSFQAEDEIAGICSAIGAAFGGSLAATTTSGPGMALKTEAIGLAAMTELPLVIVNVQRGGPSTGLPTKTEQSDLLQAVYGRNGECPIPVIAARSPFDCFDVTLEAFRIATKYMTPVIVLTDGGIANATEVGPVPDIDKLPPFEVKFRTDDPEDYKVYQRDENLARAWVRPGTRGMEHRIGGLEKDALTGDVSTDGPNHDAMVRIRADKVAGIARDFPPLSIEGAEEAELLIVSWGGTYGSVAEAVRQSMKAGIAVAHVHLRHLNPLPNDLGDILNHYQKILVPELNMGQLSILLRNKYLKDVIGFNRMEGKPLRVSALCETITELA
ncbi:MAG: 2-oxoglutarate ferredoxin oxidoreductase subunit alpha [Gammaproteobacteria bacterium]|nr:MAG: 2-oxoglutarate ferredoxin oxidoreductase subunit alpha [Gammaproteobacteria bacterium]